jgi:hypothetical protein
MATQQAEHLRLPEQDFEEMYYRKGDIDFCFLMNRRHHNLRVFDYRVGNYQQKRDFFDRIARSEGLRKVFTVVEKQDSKSWRSVGFSREGAIPGYFRTADAYIMSRVYTDDGDPIQGGAPKLTGGATGAAKPEKAKDIGKPKGITVEAVSDPQRLDAATREHGPDALYAPFRRQMFHPDLGYRGKHGRREVWVGAETDSSFGHAKVDTITAPQRDGDLPLLDHCMRVLLEQLAKQEISSVFSVCPVDAPEMNQLYADLGFKVSARLTDHVTRDHEYVGVQIWHRRITPGSVPKP